MYQTCTEYGFFQTSSQSDPIFGTLFDITFFTDLCIDVFGSEFNETLTNLGIYATNVRYGGATAHISNIAHFHGRVDPWHILGKLETIDEAGDAVIIVEGEVNGLKVFQFIRFQIICVDVAHCASLYSESSSDSTELLLAKRQIHSLIGQWLRLETSEATTSATSQTPRVAFNYYVCAFLVSMFYCKNMLI